MLAKRPGLLNERGDRSRAAKYFDPPARAAYVSDTLSPTRRPSGGRDGGFTVRWSIAILVSAAIAISYLDRQTLPWAIGAINADIPISNQLKAALDTAFLVTYGLMYLGGGRLMFRGGLRQLELK